MISWTSVVIGFAVASTIGALTVLVAYLLTRGPRGNK